MKVKEILKVTKGALYNGSADTDIDLSKVSTDSRTVRRGDLFIALKGPSFDGADFLEDALRKGAIGAVIAKSSCRGKRHPSEKIVIGCGDTTKALQAIAHSHRIRFNIPVIGITGSNGKTTTKEMVWRVLSSRYRVLKNEGTKNNHIGLPQTLLNLKSDHDMCVLEMGMNHKGELSLLADIARPTVAVITNIGPSHLEFFKDLKDVFAAKREILRSLGRNGLAVLNGDDRFLSGIKRGPFDIIRFSLKGKADFRAANIAVKKDKIRFTVNGRNGFELNMLGTHNVYNALAAIAIGRHFGISYGRMRDALDRHEPSRMRLNLKKIRGLYIIDDSYNSNPISMECALKALECYPAKSRWIVSGDMLELGKFAEYFHRQVGAMAARSAVAGLLTIGDFSEETASEARRRGMDGRVIRHCSSHDEVADTLKRLTERGDIVLIKGSRAMKMERILEKLKG